MMDMLSQYVRTLAVFMIFASVCQIVMPEGSFKRSVAFITGIMLMLIILRPINNALGSSSEWLKTGIKLNAYDAEEEFKSYGESEERIIIESFENACEEMLVNELGISAANINAQNGEDGVYIASAELYMPSENADAAVKKTAELCGISADKVIVINERSSEYNETDK